MKSKKNSYFKYFSLFFAMIVLVLVAGCGPTPTAPIINSFLANPLTITVGESSNLSWSVTDATTVIIDNAIGSVALSGTTTVTPVTTTTYTLTATNSTGSVTASVTIVGIHTVKLDKYLYNIQEDTNVSVNAGETTYLNWSLTYASQQTITLQPGSEGKDAGVETFNPLSNYEDLNFFAAGNNPAPNVLRSYIQFDLSSVPNNAIITDADLKLYHYSSWGSDAFTIGLYKVTGSWLENTITWNNQPTSSSNAEFLRSIPAGSVNYWRYWDIDDLVQGWLDGSITNRGMLLMDTDEILVQTSALFYTSDYTTDTSKHPKLEIDYYIP
jgi:hypothetical protein